MEKSHYIVYFLAANTQLLFASTLKQTLTDHHLEQIGLFVDAKSYLHSTWT